MLGTSDSYISHNPEV
jgi:glutamate--cysteine ligase catalytic subunit